MPPVPVDLAGMAGGAEHEVGIEPEQAVTPAHFAAFDRFKQEVAAPGLDQLERRADRRLGIGDKLAPDQRRLARGEASAGRPSVFRGVLG